MALMTEGPRLHIAAEAVTANVGHNSSRGVAWELGCYVMGVCRPIAHHTGSYSEAPSV